MAEQEAQQPVEGGGGGQEMNAAAMAALKAAQAAIAQSKTAPAAAVGAIGGPKVSDEEAEAAMMAQMGLDPSAMSAGSGGSTAGSAAAGGVGAQAATSAFAMPNLGGANGSLGGAKLPDGIELLGDVNLHVKIELGRTRMLVEDVLRLGEGSVVELDKLAGDPVDIYVNDRPVARGEVLVLNDNFCVRINEIIQDPGEGGRKTA